jgi:hypothetical protein
MLAYTAGFDTLVEPWGEADATPAPLDSKNIL